MKISTPAPRPGKMESLTQLYRIGRGPSSSHTMAPTAAAELYLKEHPGMAAYRATLFGSLAKTGRGHGTDHAIEDVFAGHPCEIVFSDRPEEELPHPNTMLFEAWDVDGKAAGSMEAYSVGGGALRIKGREMKTDEHEYSLTTYADIREHCERRGIRIWQYAFAEEGDNLREYLEKVWETMKTSVKNGLSSKKEYLPGPLRVKRKARTLYQEMSADPDAFFRENMYISAYAYAVSEENAAGGIIVTAPTCGACGTLPAAMYYMQKRYYLSDDRMVQALATAGIIGNLIKTNASISGAECGCQAEVGAACAMAAAALCEILNMDLSQIECAAEMAIEHHLGLTCDPVGGLVQIPCIERNAVAAMKALEAAALARALPQTSKISFDMIVKTMYETGHDLKSSYRETSEGGLAKIYASSQA